MEEINGWGGLPRERFSGDNMRANTKRMRLPGNHWKRAAHRRVQRAGRRGREDRQGVGGTSVCVRMSWETWTFTVTGTEQDVRSKMVKWNCWIPVLPVFSTRRTGIRLKKRRMNNGLNEMKAKIGLERDTAIEKELKSPCLDRLHLRIQRKSTKKIPLICEASSEQDSWCRSEDKWTLF